MKNRSRILTTIMALILTVGSIQAAEWYSSGWLYRQKITIDKDQVSGASAHVDFPVMVSIEVAANPVFAKAQSNGDDILFTSSDGVTKLVHEIDEYSDASGSEGLWAWVQIPALSPSVDTDIYMYYGNSAALDQQDAAQLWSGYVGVWHLKEEQSGTNNAGVYLDSSSFAHNGTDNIEATGKSGKIGKGQEFDESSTDWIYIDDTTALDPLTTTSVTVSAWVKTPNTDEIGGICGRTGGGSFAYDMYLASGKSKSAIRSTGGGYKYATGTTDVDDGTWHYVANMADLSASSFYANINGVSEGTGVCSGTIVSGVLDIWIGRNWGDAYLDGSIDEVRISSKSRSSDWLQTEYNNQGTPGSFIALTAEESRPSSIYSETSWYDHKWRYRQDIRVATAGITGTLTNFPLLIKATNPAFSIWSKAKSDGSDIFFTLSNGTTKVAHEIDEYDASNKELLAWVKIPEISPSTSLTLWMYYGNAAATNQQDAATLWSDYLGVWHLNEAQAGTGTASVYLDSTPNNLDGTDNVSSTGKGGLIGMGQEFDQDQSDMISVPYATVFDNINASVTVSAWIKTTDYSGGIAGRDDSAGGDIRFHVSLNAYNTRAMLRDGAGYPLATGASKISDGTWHYVANVADSSALTFYAYADGIADASQSYDGTINTYGTMPIQIGRSFYAGVSGYLEGNIDEVRVTTLPRSAAWLQAEYDIQHNPDAAITLGYDWKLPEGTIVTVR